MQNRHYQIILPLILVFTILQLMILALFGYTPYPDSNGYIDLAKECIEQQDIYPITSELNHYSFLWNIGAINAVVSSLILTLSQPLNLVYVEAFLVVLLL